MTALERIEMLAPVVAEFPEMGEFGNAAALRELLETETGSANALENGRIAPRNLLHIISANTAMAGIQSLVRGLILGSHNWCKTPAAGLPRFEEFVVRLPERLRALVDVSAALPPRWLEECGAVVVFGNDATVEHFRRRVRPDQIFAGYGQRWSGVVIFADPDFSSVYPLAQDICLYEQMGCLSAQIVWLHEAVQTAEFGGRLDAAIREFTEKTRIAPLDLAEAASVARWQFSAEWHAVENTDAKIWLQRASPPWGIWLAGEACQPGLSCLHRHVTLKRFSNMPDPGALGASVSSLAVYPFTPENRRALQTLGASRFCEVGQLQFPHPTWQQDGFPALGRLVR